MELIREIKDNYQISKSRDCDKYLDEFKNEDREYFIVLGLDTKNKVLYREITSVGTLNECSVHPREVFKGAIKRSANSLIVAHNHPSGDCEPSDADIQIHRKLERAGELLDIPVLDCLIVSCDFGIESFLSEL